MLDPIGFWSYTRHDDAHSDGELSQLRVLVGKAMGLQLGAEVKLWQDINAIPLGADWAGEIERTIGKTTFFMPIVTPRFLKSKNCLDEFEQFRKRMQALGRDDLVFPVHYVTVEGMRAEDTLFGDSLAALRRHQWIDFRPLFYADPRSRDVRKWAGDLAASVLEALHRPLLAASTTNGSSALLSEPAAPATTADTPPHDAPLASTDAAEPTPERLGARERADARPAAAEQSTPARNDPARERRRRQRVIGAALLAAAIAGLVVFLAVNRSDSPRPSPPAIAAPAAQKAAVAPENAPKPGDTFRDCAEGCPQMTVVPAGRFTMGSPAAEAGRYPPEGPQRAITIAAPLAVSTYAVTFDDWNACAARGDCRKDVPDSGWGRGRRPVINVSWDEAHGYVAWLSKTTGKSYRLLTEAEYEYVARAGTQAAYPWGDAIGSRNANCDGCGSQWDNKQTAPAGSFAPNAFGLYDTAGNVWSWVEDCWHDTYDGAPADGSAWANGDCLRRVVRGGGWSSNPRHLRTASRSKSTPGNRRNYTGFRIARSLTP